MSQATDLPVWMVRAHPMERTPEEDAHQEDAWRRIWFRAIGKTLRGWDKPPEAPE